MITREVLLKRKTQVPSIKTSPQLHLLKWSTRIDSCNIYYPQNHTNQVATMCLSPSSSYIQVAIDSASPFSTLASWSAIEPLIAISKSLSQLWATSMVPKHQQQSRILKVLICIMVLISSHDIWQFEREKVHKMRRFYRFRSIALQYGDSPYKFRVRWRLYIKRLRACAIVKFITKFTQVLVLPL